MHNSNLLPEKLKPGDVIGIVSPSEPVYAEQEVHYAAGAAWLERQGFAVREGNHVRVAPSGEVPTAAQKAEDLNRMFADPEVKAIICSQGGDSAQECLPYIDWNCIRQHPKIFTGISDITVLLNAIYQETGLVTFHGNDVVWGFGRKPQEYDRSEFIDRFVEGAIGDITWLLSDHLGSTSVTVDDTGNLLTSLKYTAFGEIRSGDSLTDYQYTGQRNESEIGLYYYIARYYDPQLGRFISADTIVPEPGSSQAYDRYAYSNNNPINFNDPSGHRACDDDYGRGCNVVHPPTVLNNNQVTYVQGFSEETLASVHQYQGNNTSFCGPYSLAIAAHLLTGNVYTGQEVNAFLIKKHQKFKNYGIPGPPLTSGGQLLLPEYEVTYQRDGTLAQLLSNVDNGVITLVGVSWQTTGEILELMFISNPANKMMKEVNVGHWMVVAGYNENLAEIILIDPGNELTAFTKYSYSDFQKIWTQQANIFIGSGDLIALKREMK